MKNLLNGIKNEQIIIVLIVLSIITSTFLSASLTGKYFGGEISKALAPLDTIYHNNCALLNANTQLSDSTTNLFLQKVEILELKKKHHKYVFTKVYINHYATVTIFPFLSGILVIISFLVAQKGWANCTDKLKAIFLSFAFLTALYGLFPTIYQQSASISQNLQNYIKLNKIQKQVFDYSITHPFIYSDSIGVKKFINQVNQQERDLDNIFFDLELKSLDNSILKGLNE